MTAKPTCCGTNPRIGTDVASYVAAPSNGNGTFKSLGPGAVYTGLGYFQLPQTDDASPLATSLTIISTQQDAISNAIFIENGLLYSKVYLPFLRK